MQLILSSVIRAIERLNPNSDDELVQRLGLNGKSQPAEKLRMRKRVNSAGIEAIWRRLRRHGKATLHDEAEIADLDSLRNAGRYAGNIENFIGTIKVPAGIVGPLRVNGANAGGDYFLPLATTEAALVASYGRGADVTARAGGISAALVSDGVWRTPAFVFANVLECGRFVNWIAEKTRQLKAAAETTTKHGKLVAIEPNMDSDTVFLMCRYTTGDAAGQNMVTAATQAMCSYIEQNTPVRPLHWFLEANFSGDKKASLLGLQAGRGRKVTASVEIPDELVRSQLRVEPEKLEAYGRVAGLGTILSGQIGAQAHYANALAAFYLATGQDVACVSESAVGYTRMEQRQGRVFFSVTMPNILVGSIGGGTSLPSQSAALSISGLKGEGKAAALAEVTAALCLCGEISIMAAIASGQFAQSHIKLARQR